MSMEDGGVRRGIVVNRMTSKGLSVEIAFE